MGERKRRPSRARAGGLFSFRQPAFRAGLTDALGNPVSRFVSRIAWKDTARHRPAAIRRRSTCGRRMRWGTGVEVRIAELRGKQVLRILARQRAQARPPDRVGWRTLRVHGVRRGDPPAARASDRGIRADAGCQTDAIGWAGCLAQSIARCGTRAGPSGRPAAGNPPSKAGTNGRCGPKRWKARARHPHPPSASIVPGMTTRSGRTSGPGRDPEPTRDDDAGADADPDARYSSPGATSARKASTTRGSKCVPRPAAISAWMRSRDHAGRYGRSLESAS